MTDWTFPGEPLARRVALCAWTRTACLPQALLSLAGASLARLSGAQGVPYRGAVVYRTRLMERLGGVCLGPAILVAPDFPDAVVAHEWGHFRQHLRLGPLYLLVIGLPSVTHALWHRAHPERDYFAFYTERWANSLGGVSLRTGHRP